MALVSMSDGAPRLEALAAGLMFMSESDRPLRVVQFDDCADDDLPELLTTASARRGALIERVTLIDFFARAVEPQAWHSPEELAVVKRYQGLVAFFTGELGEARVYRVGAIEIDAYALGKTREGEWLGVATQLVET